ncbi:MAG: 50S ribosomal protein L19 [Firmicutes bacterium]|nr:50S ribosomal protein L19 [Bacillota bacterium]
MNIIDIIEKEALRTDLPEIKIGDTLKVFVKIIEGANERVQAFEGTVIARKNGGIRETFTVRRLSFGVGVERTFPIHSPKIDRIEIVRKGRVRRAKLYYLRGRTGKAAKVPQANRFAK